MMRLFIAFPLQPEVRSGLGGIIDELRKSGGPVKWVAPNNIHLPVRFLGDTDERLVPDIKRLMDASVQGFQAASGVIDAIGGFPNLNRPRVIWAGMSRAIESLPTLASKIELGVQDLGFEAETKRFRPHFTLGRVREARGMERLVDFIRSYRPPSLEIAFDRIMLIKSTLTPKGPIYQPLHESMLAG